jgi:hypothetical protein
MARVDKIQAGLLTITAALVLSLVLAYCTGRGGPGMEWHGVGDYCPSGTFPGVTCAEDWPCAVIPAKLEDGECW